MRTRVRRLVGVPPKAALRYTLQEGRLVVSGVYASRTWTTTALRLVSRTGGAEMDVPSTATAPGFAFDVKLRKIRRELGVRDADVDLALVLRNDEGAVRLVRLGHFARTHRPFRRLATTVDDVPVRLENSVRGELSLVFGVRPQAAPAIVTHRMHRSGGELGVDVELSTRNQPLDSVQLVATGRQSGVRVSARADVVPVPALSETKNGRLVYAVRARLPLAEVATLPDSEETVDLHLLVGSGSADERWVRVRAPRGRRGRWMRSVAVTVGDRTTQLVPYSTFRAHNVSYRVERFDAADYRMMRRLAPFGWVFVLTRPFTRIWLVGEVPYKAQDNGYQLFRHLRTHHPRRRAYYVIDAASPDRARVEPLGNVVLARSRRHILYTMAASRLVGSHHAEYLLATRDRSVARWARGVRVFLQHGPTANKNVTLNYGRQGTAERPTERWVAISDLEKRIVVEDYGYRPHQVSVAGFARFDQLFADDVERERTVLVMPTWRDSLMQEEAFLASDYFANWRDFLRSPDLHEALTDAGLQVKLLLHPNMRKYAHHFESDVVSVVRQGDVDVQRMLKASAVLITDFSSVCWDFAFLHKPVLFFQFDRSELVRKRAPHIDFDSSLPGPIAATPAALVREVRATIERGLQMEPEHVRRADQFIAHRDQHNCERIERVVARSWNARVAFERVRNNELVQLGWTWYRRSPWYFRSMRVVNAVGRVLPRTDVVLFECDRGEHYGDAPRYLYERLSAREHDLRMVWASNTTLRLTDPRARKIRRHSPTYWWVASRARYWVNNQNFPAELRKGRGTRFLQTWHGTPLKRMQHDVEQMAGRDGDYHKRAARLTGYWDVLLSASDYATRAFRSAFRFEGTVLELGYPRNDVFSWPGADERAAQVRGRLGLADDERRIILYAPTFRDDERSGVHWRQQLRLDLPALERALADRYVLVVRYHQLVRNALPEQYRDSSFVVDASTYPDVQELMAASDVLVTDYSSLFFDYAALRRPMVFFAYDLERYRDELRGFYLDYDTQVPGPVVRTNEELVDTLDRLDDVWPGYGERLEEFRQRYGPLDDGNASDRVLDAFFGTRVGPVQQPAVPSAAPADAHAVAR
ncbi:CDP-glycerol glycerophosphotransferase family protein [Cellulomonas massiliensis]|uniref:CDP-glycerol glycerophosphotransferase family protein n=1 Tax=Cellulomonas massiliensis TaxID=1465811 RepID=UPI0013756CB9|nr:CDP-glycerol glycerophosphotransferase family protein [Cellulomonas massiliensis]